MRGIRDIPTGHFRPYVSASARLPPSHRLLLPRIASPPPTVSPVSLQDEILPEESPPEQPVDVEELLFLFEQLDTGQNGDKSKTATHPKRRQPKRRHIQNDDNQNGDTSKPATRQNGDTPKRRHAKTASMLVVSKTATRQNGVELVHTGILQRAYRNCHKYL